MIRELGERVRLLRKGNVYADCYAVVSPAAVGTPWKLEARKKQVTGTLHVESPDLPKLPRAGDRLTVSAPLGDQPVIYYITTVTSGNTDPMIHMDLAS